MGARPVGVMSVACPSCRAAVGRPCVNRRGYLTVAHYERESAWIAAETAELAAVRAAEAPA